MWGEILAGSPSGPRAAGGRRVRRLRRVRPGSARSEAAGGQEARGDGVSADRGARSGPGGRSGPCSGTGAGAGSSSGVARRGEVPVGRVQLLLLLGGVVGLGPEDHHLPAELRAEVAGDPPQPRRELPGRDRAEVHRGQLLAGRAVDVDDSVLGANPQAASDRRAVPFEQPRRGRQSLGPSSRWPLAPNASRTAASSGASDRSISRAVCFAGGAAASSPAGGCSPSGSSAGAGAASPRASLAIVRRRVSIRCLSSASDPCSRLKATFPPGQWRVVGSFFPSPPS